MNGPGGRHTTTDDAICLQRHEFSETSLVVVLLCRQTGKVSVLAKGARRPKSAVAVDILDEGQAVFVAKAEGLGLLHSFSHGPPRPALRRDLDRWRVGLYFAELAANATTELNPAEGLYNLLVRALERACVAESRGDLAYTLVAGTRKILDWAGYTPQLRRCVGCDRAVGEREPLYVSPSQGGVVCRDCEPTIVDKTRLSRRAWLALRGKAHDGPALAEGFETLALMLREHMGKTPKMHAHCRGIFKEEK